MLVSQQDDGAASPLDHEKRFYTAADGQLYVALGLPVYLHLSATPAAGVGSHALHETGDGAIYLVGANLFMAPFGGKFRLRAMSSYLLG